MLVGYARLAPQDAAPKDDNTQEAALRGAGCRVVFCDRLTTYPAQPQLERALSSLRQHDVLVVTSLDRLAGGLRDLIGRMHQVQSNGASVRALQGSIDTCTASGSQLLATLLSFDRQVAGDRIQHGMRAARKQGQHVGRPRLLAPQTVQLAAARMRAGEPVPQIARSIGVSPQTLRRALQAQLLAAELHRESHP